MLNPKVLLPRAVQVSIAAIKAMVAMIASGAMAMGLMARESLMAKKARQVHLQKRIIDSYEYCQQSLPIWLFRRTGREPWRGYHLGSKSRKSFKHNWGSLKASSFLFLVFFISARKGHVAAWWDAFLSSWTSHGCSRHREMFALNLRPTQSESPMRVVFWSLRWLLQCSIGDSWIHETGCNRLGGLEIWACGGVVPMFFLAHEMCNYRTLHTFIYYCTYFYTIYSM